MNWGYRIVFSFILFASFVFYLVFRMIGSGNDLLKQKYYRSGPEINTELKLMEQSQDLKNRIQIIRKNDEINLKLVISGCKEPITGEMELICLSSEKGDFKSKIDLQKMGDEWVQEIVVAHPQEGTWLLEMKGMEGSKPFLIKREFQY
jgi:hypothetical protein